MSERERGGVKKRHPGVFAHPWLPLRRQVPFEGRDAFRNCFGHRLLCHDRQRSKAVSNMNARVRIRWHTARIGRLRYRQIEPLHAAGPPGATACRILHNESIGLIGRENSLNATQTVCILSRALRSVNAPIKRRKSTFEENEGVPTRGQVDRQHESVASASRPLTSGAVRESCNIGNSDHLPVHCYGRSCEQSRARCCRDADPPKGFCTV